MAAVEIIPSELCGIAAVPESKSIMHRAIICASLACGSSSISPVTFSNDVVATINAVTSLGAKVVRSSSKLRIYPICKNLKKHIFINCQESASTLRLCLPIATMLGVNARFLGSGRLSERPMNVYYEILPKFGVNISSPYLPIDINQKLKNGVFKLPGNISSQFISGLVLALPLLQGNSTIVLTTPLLSFSYLDLTLDIMRKFKVFVQKNNNSLYIHGNQIYKPLDINIENDWSQAAFFAAAGAIGNEVTIKNLNFNSIQGDKIFLYYLENFGAVIIKNEDSVTVKHHELHAVKNLNIENTPDIFPILAVVAALAKGTTTITGIERLRIKESDRVKAVCYNFNVLGVPFKVKNNAIYITGVSQFNGGIIDSFNDHRIAMAFSIAATRATSKVIILKSQSVNKSFPNFYKVLNRLGCNLTYIE